MRRQCAFFVVFLACTGDPKTEVVEEEVEAGIVDGDNDGYLSDEDCNDAQSNVHPNATEVCDGIDNDCDDQVDEDVLTTSYADIDADGYGDPDNWVELCEIPAGYVPIANDCDDGDADVYPGASERCDDVDNDCDGDIDEDLVSSWYVDLDGDGFGNEEDSVTGCDPDSGLVDVAGDCNDGDEAIHPDAEEVCDDVDNDCDGEVDENQLMTWYADADGDGYGDVFVTEDSCELPSGYVEDSTDCDDTDAGSYPSATEVCDYVDQDCDDETDEDFRTGALYTDHAHCGYCNNDCDTYIYAQATTFCDTTLSTPACEYDCDTGFYDSNGDPDDGCECEQTSTTDDPFDGMDTDCDGDDGDHADAIHVSADTGSPFGDGSLTDPLTSIQDGIDQALLAGLSYVLVAEGSYDEDIELFEGLILFGGYDVGFTTRDVYIYDSAIIGTGTASATIIAVDILSTTIVDGFTIQGNANTRDGSSAVGLWIEDCDSNLQVSNNLISADDAFDGSDSDDGSDGDVGLDGSDGQNAKMGTCSSLSSGGRGAAMTCHSGENADGGTGAAASCPSYLSYQDDGDSGDGLDGGPGGDGACDAVIQRTDCGLCSVDTVCWGIGGDGDFGGDGDHGTGGVGALIAGSVVSGLWFPENGADGDVGDAGSGGGGGGAGSGVEVHSTCSNDHISATGGGGGSGGCGGTGGEGGQGGGSSFGILFTCSGTCLSLPVIVNNEIYSANAGDGGDGGHGGTGGFGGYGGQGGGSSSLAWCALDGGAGGDGGEGGNGGGGGGGAGGHSYAVYADGVVPSVSWVMTDNLMDFGYAGRGGSGGAGGDSGTHGSDGADGEQDFQNW